MAKVLLRGKIINYDHHIFSGYSNHFKTLHQNINFIYIIIIFNKSYYLSVSLLN
jgi:hypothetical protein